MECEQVITILPAVDNSQNDPSLDNRGEILIEDFKLTSFFNSGEVQLLLSSISNNWNEKLSSGQASVKIDFSPHVINSL